MRKLQNGKGVVALADADGNRVALRPALFKASLLPFPRRKNTPSFSDEIDPRDLSEPERLHEIMDTVDAHLLSQRVVIHVGGNDDRTMHVDRTVTAAAGGIAEYMVAQLKMTVVVDHAFGITHFHFQRGQRHEGLKRRPDRIRSSERAVHERLVFVLIETVPGFLVNAVNKKIRIKARIRNEREDVTRRRLDGNNGSAPIAELFHNFALQAHIQRQYKVISALRLRHRKRTDRAARSPYFDLFKTGLAVQNVFV